MISPTQCFKEDMLAAIVRAEGLEEVEIFKLTNGDFYLKIRIASNPMPYYLSTQRSPSEPRIFKKIDAVVSVALKLFGDECKFVVRQQK